MDQHNKINYLEIPVKDLAQTKHFFNQAFGWDFTDYGPEYSCFNHAGITGGFYLSSHSFELSTGSVLIVIYSDDLLESISGVEGAGGTVVKPIFSFPGGKRFHFKDPNGNEFAVWSQ